VRTHPARVDVLRVGKEGAQLRFVLHEGRNRQVRNMAEAVGLSVRSLKRIRVGPFTTRGLQAGACRLLGKREVGVLRKLVGLGEESS
ncbi:MAG: pseudouridine synthase, partial [Fimbriimonas ginsengisoli]|nr:pseudouridine synthase [Fimbriimonas ginsengisoli]